MSTSSKPPVQGAEKPIEQFTGKRTENMVESCEDQQEDFGALVERVGTALCDYGRRRPGVAVAAILGLGFFVGWKIKPW